MKQLDIKTAFLNGDLQEEIYIQQPEVFVIPAKEFQKRSSLPAIKKHLRPQTGFMDMEPEVPSVHPTIWCDAEQGRPLRILSSSTKRGRRRRIHSITHLRRRRKHSQ